MPGWPLAFSGRSEQPSDTRLSNALADQSSCTVPVDMPLPAVRFSTCPAKQAGLTACLLWSIWATLWLSLQQRSSWQRLRTCHSGHFFPTGWFHRGYVRCTHAFSFGSCHHELFTWATYRRKSWHFNGPNRRLTMETLLGLWWDYAGTNTGLK